MSSVTVHVFPEPKGWAVKKIGRKAHGVFATQKEAIESARKMARDAAPGQLVVHGKDGSLRQYATYGLPRIAEAPKGVTAAGRKIGKVVGKVALARLRTDSKPRKG